MLAAAAAVVTATAAIAAVVAAAQTVVAAAAEQDQQDDDPAHIPTAETVVIHKNTSRIILSRGFVAAHSKIFRCPKSVQTQIPVYPSHTVGADASAARNKIGPRWDDFIQNRCN